MATKVLVAFYSSYGHVFRLAQAVAEGARAIADTEVRLRRIPELEAARLAMWSQPAYVKAQQAQRDVPEISHDDLRWADGICWGTPTRYGNMSAQLKQFLDSLGALWQKGELEDKPAGVFTSTPTTQGGHETTTLGTMAALLHFGMALIGTPYGQNPQMMTTDRIGSSPYGPGTIAGSDGSLQPIEADLQTARNLGARIARFGCALKSLCAETRRRRQPGAPQYEAA
jgi:NAD(P)H dehydrogenase (quinone)